MRVFECAFTAAALVFSRAAGTFRAAMVQSQHSAGQTQGNKFSSNFASPA
jgi:hypothetical protein